MHQYAIEDMGNQTDDQDLVPTEYWPSSDDSSSCVRSSSDSSSSPAPWWAQSNWFRASQAKTQQNNSSPSCNPATPLHPLHSSDSAAVEYGGWGHDAQLGERYAMKATQGIGHSLNTKKTQPVNSVNEAPGGADVFCRFMTSSKPSTSQVIVSSPPASSLVPSWSSPSSCSPAPAPAPAPALQVPQSIINAPSLLARAIVSPNTNTLPHPTKASKLLLASLSGYDACVKKQVYEHMILPLFHTSLFKSLGVKPSRAVLLSGEPGTGKSLLLDSLVGELPQLYFHRVDCPLFYSELCTDLAVRKTLSNAEQTRDGAPVSLGEPGQHDLFSSLIDSCIKHAPSLLFLDDVQVLTRKPVNNEHAYAAKIRTIIKRGLDKIYQSNAPVMVVGATHHLSEIDEMFIRPSRFNHTIVLNKPNEEGRYEILQKCCRSLKLSSSVDLRSLAVKSLGFVGADLANLCCEAGMECVREYVRQHAGSDDDEGVAINVPPSDQLVIQHQHFERALQLVMPASSRSFAQSSPVQFHEIGGTVALKQIMVESVQHPLIYPHVFEKFGLQPSTGMLLYGPPGCGKTLIAQAIAKHARASFLSVKGPELLSSYLGESESNIRAIFAKARASSPCVLFFDEIDSIGLSRAGGKNDATCDRVLNQLLTEFDNRGMGAGKTHQNIKQDDKRESKENDDDNQMKDVDQANETSMNESSSSSPSSSSSFSSSTVSSSIILSSIPPIVFVIGATNRPDLLDGALLRPGRFDQLLYVGVPNQEERFDIINKQLHNAPLEAAISQDNYAFLHELARNTARYSGADLVAICNQAKKLAIAQHIKTHDTNTHNNTLATPQQPVFHDLITTQHLKSAHQRVIRSVSDEMIDFYTRFHDSIQNRDNLLSVHQVLSEVEDDAARELASPSVFSSVHSSNANSPAPLDDSTSPPSPSPSPSPSPATHNSSNNSVPSSTLGSSRSHTTLASLRSSLQHDIEHQLSQLQQQGDYTPQQALNLILSDLLKQTNANAWKSKSNADEQKERHNIGFPNNIDNSFDDQHTRDRKVMGGRTS